MVPEVLKAMTVFLNGEKKLIAHFLKVYTWAKTIGELEGLDAETQETLELAAIVHDIAIPCCMEKYGKAPGNLQEQESEPVLRRFLKPFDLPKAQEERIVWLVCHHHTVTDVDGIDHRILLEADFLVNADEGSASEEAIRNARERFYRTAAGTALLKSIYRLED